MHTPRTIWTYWDNPDAIPRTVKKCIQRIKEYNPHDKVILLTKNNFKGYVTIPPELITDPSFNDMPARFADLVRIWVLAEHGGIWVDSSTIVNESFNWVFPWFSNEYEFSGFYIDEMTRKGDKGDKGAIVPVIENWFFACVKGSPFVRKWRDEFSMISHYSSVEAYVQSRIKMGVDIQGIKIPIYLAMHIAAQKVLQIDKYPLDTLVLRKAEDGAFLHGKWQWSVYGSVAPFRYLVEAKWNSEKALERCHTDAMIKLRGAERNIIEKRDDLLKCYF